MAFSPPVVGCLVKKGLEKGGSQAPQDPPFPGCLYLQKKMSVLNTIPAGIIQAIDYIFCKQSKLMSDGQKSQMLCFSQI